MLDAAAAKRTWTVPRLAEELAVKEQVILQWIRSGELKACNLAANAKGRRPRWRILPNDLEDFLRRRSTAPAAATPAPRRRPRSTATEYF